jgi:nicotinate phosphoribosyltransferase
MGDTVKATLAFDKYMPAGVSRVALVDTFKDEAEESLLVAEALGERLGSVRLDTPGERGRVTADLVKEVRARLGGESQAGPGGVQARGNFRQWRDYSRANQAIYQRRGSG